jgi:hypothetical protein
MTDDRPETDPLTGLLNSAEWQDATTAAVVDRHPDYVQVWTCEPPEMDEPHIVTADRWDDSTDPPTRYVDAWTHHTQENP